MHDKPTTLNDIYARAQSLLKSCGSEQAIEYLGAMHAQMTSPSLSENELKLGFIALVSRQDPIAALSLLEPLLDAQPTWINARLIAMSLLDRTGNRTAARASALVIIDSAHASPEQVLGACNLLIRLEDDSRALVFARTAFEQLGGPLRWADSLLYISLLTADWQTTRSLVAQIQNAYATGCSDEIVENPRTHLLWCGNETDNLAMIKQWSQHTFPHLPAVTPLIPQPLAGRRLRIGYLSSDFREHPGARLINGLFRNHDTSKLELFLYCSGWDDGSEIRKKILSHFEHVHSVTALSDASAADLMRSHKLDVLVERNGPTRAGRMGILAYRPAPVQIGYLGWPGSFGGRVVDYVVGDSYTVPPGAEKLYPEKVIRIHGIYQVNDYSDRCLPMAPERSAVGLPEGALVLGMFNTINKVRDEVWSVWMQILKYVPNAVLWLLDPGVTARKNLAVWTHGLGVDPRRILAAPHLPHEAHMARLQYCDLILDPWPYGGHTSTSDALFAGVPVVTLEGRNFAGRVSGGLLKAAGLEALVQPDIHAYVRTVVNLLQRSRELARLKRYLRDVVPGSDVFNAAGKARQLEAAYRMAVERVAAGLEPKHMTLRM